MMQVVRPFNPSAKAALADSLTKCLQNLDNSLTTGVRNYCIHRVFKATVPEQEISASRVGLGATRRQSRLHLLGG